MYIYTHTCAQPIVAFSFSHKRVHSWIRQRLALLRAEKSKVRWQGLCTPSTCFQFGRLYWWGTLTVSSGFVVCSKKIIENGVFLGAKCSCWSDVRTRNTKKCMNGIEWKPLPSDVARMQQEDMQVGQWGPTSNLGSLGWQMGRRMLDDWYWITGSGWWDCNWTDGNDI